MDMEAYMNDWDDYETMIVYNFPLRNGGIGDCIKFFMFALNYCIKHRIRLYYLKNDIALEKYLILTHKRMYLSLKDLKHTQTNNIQEYDNLDAETLCKNTYHIVKPQCFWGSYDRFNMDMDYFIVPVKEVWGFSEEVKENVGNLLPELIDDYISIHLRLGDDFLDIDIENNEQPTGSLFDRRYYNETKLFQCIEDNDDKKILFFCDNASYKRHIKQKYGNVILTDCNIRHTSSCTEDKPTMDTVTDFYILSNSKEIIIASNSGFSIMASKFNNVPLRRLT